MSFKLWVTTGLIDTVHPAGLMLFTAALALSLLLKKSFCGWICPVGTLSELLGTTGRRIAGRLLTTPRWLDVPLRSLKYALMGFFLWIILVKMPAAGIGAWLQTDYWKIADLKMLGFFRHPTALATGILGALAVLSLVTRNFWCRYLCPYGALLGLLSFGAAVKVQRNEGGARTATAARRTVRRCCRSRSSDASIARVPGVPDLRQPLSGTGRARCGFTESPDGGAGALRRARGGDLLGDHRGGEIHRPLGSRREPRRIPADRPGTGVGQPPLRMTGRLARFSCLLDP